MRKILFIFAAAFLLTSCNTQAQESKSDNIKAEEECLEGLILFSEPGEVLNVKSYKVFQVLKKGYALAHGLSNASYGFYFGPVYLLRTPDHYFYDEEIVKISAKMADIQVGVYKYMTDRGSYKTVPVVSFIGK